MKHSFFTVERLIIVFIGKVYTLILDILISLWYINLHSTVFKINDQPRDKHKEGFRNCREFI
jgi:hypothetical protein